MDGQIVEVTYAHYRVPEIVVEAFRQRNTEIKGSPKEEHCFPYSRKLKGQFVPAPNGGKTVCRIHNLSTGQRVTGTAICSYGDNFSYEKGRLVAFERALEQLK